MMKMIFLYLHILGACVWVGGHLILMVRYLPEAFKLKSLSNLLSFEEKYEKIGMPFLIIQILTGLYLAQDWTDNYRQFFDLSQPVVKIIWIKLGLLLTTISLALDVKLRILPKISNESILDLSLHIIPVTLMGLMFAFLGMLIRFGGVI